MALISVIVPVCNTEKYLRRCVESILRQSFSDFELILIDDGSADGSGKICEEYAEKDNRVIIIHQTHGGPSAARNTGIEYAIKNSESEWIICVDSDDFIGGKLFEKLLKAARDADTDIALTGYVRVEAGEEINEPDGGGAEILSPEEFYVARRAEATVVWGKLYKKQLLANIRFPVGKLHEDEFVTYRLLFACPRIAVLDDPLYYYVKNPSGIMLGEWNIHRTDLAEGLADQVEFFRENGFAEAEQTAARALFMGCAMSLGNMADSKNEHRETADFLRRQLRKTKRRYKLDAELAGGKRNYLRLAHPTADRIRIKAKHALIAVKKVFHA